MTLLAIIERPSNHHAGFDQVWLATVRRGTDLRVFNSNAPPWPESAEATDLGAALAQTLAIPFFFSNPDTPTPDIDQPRRWDTLT